MEWLFEQFYKYSFGSFKAALLSLAQKMAGLSLDFTGDFWNDSTLDIILDFSFYANIAVFTITILFYIGDIAQEASSRSVDWGFVVGNFSKALIFAYFNRWLALFAMQTADILVKALNLNEEMKKMPDKITEIIAQIQNTKFDLVVVGIILISSTVFFFIALLRFGAMLIQILTSSFYISGIMRGDNQKMTEWITQTIAIATTFVFQHLLYYLGVYFLLRSNTVIGLGLMLSITQVGKIMQKFSFTTGTQGTISGVARMAGFVAPRFM